MGSPVPVFGFGAFESEILAPEMLRSSLLASDVLIFGAKAARGTEPLDWCPV